MKIRAWFAMAVVAVAMALALPAAAWAASPTPSYDWYNGKSSPYSLSTPQQWAGFVELVNGTADSAAAGTSEDSFAGKVVNVTGSINFLNMSVKPAGGQNGKSFAGALNGNGNTLSQFSIDTSGGTSNVGLIGAYTGPGITGVKVGVGSSIAIDQPAGGAVVANVGMLVGSASGSGAIASCENMGSITVTSAVSQSDGVDFLVENVGGLVGITTGSIDGCANLGALSVTQSSNPRTENEQAGLVANVGGIVGSLGTVDSSLADQNPAAYDMAHGSLSGCTNSATITVNTPSEAGKDRFGQTTYAQSYNVGGIAGYSRGSISNCTNSGYLAAERANGIGGIVGSLRTRTPSSTYSGNFSSEGSDDGMVHGSADAIAIRTCSNSGDVQGFVFAAGIAGRAGTFTAITDCLNGLTTAGANADTYVVAHRWNKPFPAGIAGSTYGEVSYCANFASVASVSDFNHSTKSITTQSGYYASGLVGNTSRFTDSSLTPQSPLPEVFGCYNVGNVLAVANMRQRALVGDNGGFVHDNVALQGCVSTNDLIYGDDANESEASGGSSSNNTFATEAQLRGTAFLDESTGATVIGTLNSSADAGQWAKYWAQSNSNSLNQGYPVLNRQVTWNRQDIASATVAWAADAEYTGSASVPKATVSLNGNALTQNVDFRVVPQATGIEVTNGARSYTASIEGVGSYTGTKANAFAYGMGKGNLANCTVAIDSQQYNAAAQTISPEGVHVRNPAGSDVDASEFAITIDPDDANLTDGKAVRAKKYATIVTASASSPHFYGTNKSGVFNISTAKIVCSSASDTSAGNRAQPTAVSCMGKTVNWFSNTANPNATDSELRAAGAVFPYTGHPIKPAVTKVEFDGTTVTGGPITLTEGVDYRVVYGETSIDTATNSTDNVGKKGEVSRGYIMVRYVQGSNFSNYEIMTFLIDGTATDKLDLAKAEVKGPSSVIYESEAGAYRPMTVWYGGSQLTEGVDYTIDYSKNTGIGTATYTVQATDDGLFTGSVSGSFDIVKGDPYTLSYTYNSDGTAAVTGVTYNGTLDTYKLSIPATVTNGGKTYTVASIADKAFGSNNASELTDSQTKIGSVEVPATVKSIGEWAFCTANAVTFEASNIAKVTFAEGSQLETIGRGAFRNLGATEIAIPAGVKSIASQAFARSSLKTVTFATQSAAIPEIASDAFQYVYNGDAVYDAAKAASVDAYAKATLAGQNWTANGKAIEVDPDDPAPSKPAYTTWTRLWGAAAPDTMKSIVEEGWESAGTVILTTNATFPDALSASSVAGMAHAPVVMTDPNALNSQARSLLVRLKPTKIIAIGGKNAVSDATLAAAAAATGVTTATVRLAGDTRYETAEAVMLKAAAETGGTWSDTAFVCRGDNFKDALSASPIAYANNMPIVLANREAGRIPDSSLAAMKAVGVKKVYALGGTAAVPESIINQLKNAGYAVERIAGATGVDTSNLIAKLGVEKYGMSADNMAVSTDGNFKDALAGGALCGLNKGVMLLVNGPACSGITDFVAKNKDDIGTAYIFGGTAAVSAEVEAALKAATANHSNAASAQSADLVAASGIKL